MTRRINLSQRQQPRRNKPTYRIENADGPTATLYLYGEIGFWGTTAEQFSRDLNAITAPTIDVRINSGGGDVFDGMAMFTALKGHPANIVTHIDGLAASAATYPALAGDEIQMSKGAFLMIHDPMSIMVGTAEDMRKEADVLDKIRDSIAGVYVDRTGAKLATVKKWMAAETWFNADEALSEGFIDSIAEEAAAKNQFDLSIYNNVPDSLRRRQTDDEPNLPGDVRAFEQFLRDAGWSNAAAKAIAVRGFKPTESKPRDEGDRVEIAAVCSAARTAFDNARTMTAIRSGFMAQPPR